MTPAGRASLEASQQCRRGCAGETTNNRLDTQCGSHAAVLGFTCVRARKQQYNMYGPAEDWLSFCIIWGLTAERHRVPNSSVLPVGCEVLSLWGQPALSNRPPSSQGRWWTAMDSWSSASTAAETLRLVRYTPVGICNKEVPAWQRGGLCHSELIQATKGTITCPVYILHPPNRAPIQLIAQSFKEATSRASSASSDYSFYYILTLNNSFMN